MVTLAIIATRHLETTGLKRMPSSTRACRAVGNAREAPSSVRMVTLAIIATKDLAADNVLRNDSAFRSKPPRVS